MKGLQFFKMTGSGNDFVVFDTRGDPRPELMRPELVQQLCARGTGVGADGIVLLEKSPQADYRMIYFNSDGSRASMCGNAALCVTALVLILEPAASQPFTLETDSGILPAAIREGVPAIELAPVSTVLPSVDLELRPGEERIGYADAGVPHLVLAIGDVAQADVEGRGGELRRHPSLARGANVNFVSQGRDRRWSIRTYERGVESETLACGTGAVATAILLAEWGLSGHTTSLETRSGEPLTVILQRSGSTWIPTLSGEGRLVFMGTLA
ncbi:MAG: diaminopimelate epimerase [Gemmatimonadaceae bacterium]